MSAPRTLTAADVELLADVGRGHVYIAKRAGQSRTFRQRSIHEAPRDVTARTDRLRAFSLVKDGAEPTSQYKRHLVEPTDAGRELLENAEAPDLAVGGSLAPDRTKARGSAAPRPKRGLNEIGRLALDGTTMEG